MVLLSSRVKAVRQFINKLYAEDINPYYLSLQYREENKIEGEEFTYGEVEVESFAKMLIKAQPKSGEIFYDLGCGAGKAVFIAALLFPFLKARGIELLPPLYNVCINLQKQFKRLILEDSFFVKDAFNIKFLQGDLKETDFFDGTLFFLNATCFPEADWQALQKKLSRLSIGARLIVITRHIEISHFDLIEAGTYQMSWGPSSAYIYRKIK